MEGFPQDNEGINQVRPGRDSNREAQSPQVRPDSLKAAFLPDDYAMPL